jgi:hypothetical protein
MNFSCQEQTDKRVPILLHLPHFSISGWKNVGGDRTLILRCDENEKLPSQNAGGLDRRLGGIS